jgi:hypothetical protein
MRKAWLIIPAVWVIVSSIGCVELTPAQQAKINLAQQNAQVQVAETDAQGQVDDANGAADPVEHPVDSANVVIKKAQPVLGKIALLAFIAVCVFGGLMLTEFSAVSKVGLPVSGALLAGSIMGLFALPAVPYVGVGLAACLLALIGYETYQHGIKGLLSQLLTAATFGIVKAAPAIPPALTPVKVIEEK